MTATEETTRASHYDRIGGAAAVKAAVELFYDKVLADPDLAGYFADVDMAGQRRHLALMLATVLGGPDEYAGRGLAEAHQPLNIPAAHYAMVGEHLVGDADRAGRAGGHHRRRADRAGAGAGPGGVRREHRGRLSVDVARLKQSWSLVAAHGDQVPLYFYSSLFLAHPETRQMFPTNMAGQRDRSVTALGHIVSNVDQVDRLVGFLQDLGADHRKFAVAPEHYPAVGEALLGPCGTSAVTQWTEELAEDWAAAYGLVAQVMTEAAQAAENVIPALVGGGDRGTRTADVRRGGAHAAPAVPVAVHPGPVDRGVASGGAVVAVLLAGERAASGRHDGVACAGRAGRRGVVPPGLRVSRSATGSTWPRRWVNG